MLETNKIMSLFSTSEVYVDTSVLTDQNFIHFINNNYEWLMENKCKFHIHALVKKYFKNLKEKEDSRGIVGLYILDYLESKKMVDYFENGEEEYSPLAYISHFVENYLSKKMVLFSNDNRISKDIITINHFGALSTLKTIIIYRVNNNGEVGYYNSLNKVS
jgi:rRNA-processing protein FCF1